MNLMFDIRGCSNEAASWQRSTRNEFNKSFEKIFDDDFMRYRPGVYVSIPAESAFWQDEPNHITVIVHGMQHGTETGHLPAGEKGTLNELSDRVIEIMRRHFPHKSIGCIINSTVFYKGANSASFDGVKQ